MVAAPTMPKKSTSPRNDVSVKIDAAILVKARLVASDQGIPMSQYLSELLRPRVDSDYANLGDRIVKETRKSK